MTPDELLIKKDLENFKKEICELLKPSAAIATQNSLKEHEQRFCFNLATT